MNFISLIRKARILLICCMGVALSALQTGCIVTAAGPAPIFGVGIGGPPGFGGFGVPGFYPGFYSGPSYYGSWHYHGDFPYYGYHGWRNGYYGCHHCHGANWYRW